MRYIIIVFFLMLETVNAQINNPTSIITSPTSWEVLGNTFSHHNRTWMDSLKLYGSGDVNLDSKVDILDLQAVNNGISNIELEIDGDAVFFHAE